MKPAHLSHMVPSSAAAAPLAELGPTPRLVAMHVLRWLASRHTHSGRGTSAQGMASRACLDDIVTGIGARRAEARSVLSSLHREGYYDVVRGRLTLAGFTVGRSLADSELTPLRGKADEACPGMSALSAA